MRQRRPHADVVAPEPLPSTPSNGGNVSIKWSSEPEFTTNAVVQAIKGDHRGFIGIVGHIDGSKLWTYHIVPNQAGMGKVELQAGDCVVIGKARVASRNPFPDRQSKPEPPPEADVNYDPDDPAL
jgi:hypothetical protein